MAMKTQQLKPLGSSKSSSKREIYSNKILPQETRKTSNRQFNFTPTPIGKKKKKNKKTQSQQKGRNHKDWNRNK